MFVISFASERASADHPIPAPTGVDAWIEYDRGGGLTGLNLDFNFNPDTREDGLKVVGTYRIDVRYRRNSNTAWNSDYFGYDRSSEWPANTNAWQPYIEYTNTSHPCPVNVVNPDDDPVITKKNRECSIATVWPKNGVGEYQARIVPISPTSFRPGQDPASAGHEGTPSRTISSLAIEEKPGVANIQTATGVADPGNATRGGINLAWGQADRAAEYIVQWATADSGIFGHPDYESEFEDDVRSAVIGGLQPNTAYLVRVIAVAQFGRQGDPSNVVEVTTRGTRTTTTTPPPTTRTLQQLMAVFDTDRNGVLSKAEADAAIAGPNALTNKTELYILLDFYFSQGN
ncbi:MAG: fibronectin type III domain-containing protein [Chloroflexota bacterium]|nr:fibronectin type III domain-containing protein [Chloroflexota bacterium]